MIVFKTYDDNTKTDTAWVQSSNIVYTRMVENETENTGNLFITFKNGATYKYKDVTFEDYLVFIGGGVDMSQGKTFFKIIKPKYDCERVDDENVEKINEMLQEALVREKNK